jgi:aminomethyltransferase
MDDPAQGPGTQVKVLCADGSTQSGELCTLPMYDANRLIPRGKLVDIPTSPIAAE